MSSGLGFRLSVSERFQQGGFLEEGTNGHLRIHMGVIRTRYITAALAVSPKEVTLGFLGHSRSQDKNVELHHEQ